MISKIALLPPLSLFRGGLLNDEKVASSLVFDHFLLLILGLFLCFHICNVFDYLNELEKLALVLEEEFFIYFVEGFQLH